jgi:hypothetical protein
MRSVHELAREIAKGKVESARSVLARLEPQGQRDWLRVELAKRLGDIEPTGSAGHGSLIKKLPDARLKVSRGSSLTLLCRSYFPSGNEGSVWVPVVVGIAKAGKEVP